MDIKSYTTKLPVWIKKYRIPILVLALGLLLMLLPTTSQKAKTKTVTQTTQPVMNENLEERLSQILSQISGVGRVEVMLTVRSGETTVYQTDEDITTTENGTSIRKETVIISDSGRNQQPIISQILPLQYMGAVIVCQGADDVQVRLAVVEAVTKATGLRADKITVLKMK